MAPPQSIQVLDPLPWPRSTVTEFAQHELENGGQLATNVSGQPPAWIVPPPADREPNPPFGYVVIFVRHHECGFTAPASRFMRAAVLPLWRGAAQFCAECDHAGSHLCHRVRGIHGDPSELGSLGPPFPRGAAHALHAGAASAPRGARRRDDHFAAGVTQGILHSLHDDFQQCGMGAGVVLPSQRRAWPPPYTGKVLSEKADSWWHGLSPSSRQDRLEFALCALKSLADVGLGAASVLANLHHRRITPLM
jgi:hypothetical protein